MFHNLSAEFGEFSPEEGGTQECCAYGAEDGATALKPMSVKGSGKERPQGTIDKQH
jgi:hypothetical protein